MVIIIITIVVYFKYNIIITNMLICEYFNYYACASQCVHVYVIHFYMPKYDILFSL